MPAPRFLQIHTLHSYPAALLNRDDSGLAKRMPFGGTTRTRISSQCLKKHWKSANDEYSLKTIAGAPLALRSRDIVIKKVIAPLREEGNFTSEVLDSVEAAFNIGVYGSSGTTTRGRQALLLGLPEVEHLHQRAAAICAANAADPTAAAKAATDLFRVRHGEGTNFKGLLDAARLPAGLESALFGRMITSDTRANIEAAIHVAHAFTVHSEESESDYFSAMDDLQDEDETGAALISETELTAGLFYGYVVVDIPGLISNLEGCHPDEWQDADRTLASVVVEHLLHLIATVSPGAKLGSTAPYTFADLTLIEAGTRQPRSLANAFRNPAEPQVDAAVERLNRFLGNMDKCYGAKESRRLAAIEDCQLPMAQNISFDDLAAWAEDAIMTGEAND